MDASALGRRRGRSTTSGSASTSASSGGVNSPAAVSAALVRKLIAIPWLLCGEYLNQIKCYSLQQALLSCDGHMGLLTEAGSDSNA